MNSDSFVLYAGAVWDYIQLSRTLQLFVISAALLAIGLAYEVWAYSVRLSFLDRTSLQTIEKTHPYLPQLKMLVSTFLCCAALLVVALQTITGFSSFARPMEWLYLAAFFLITGAIGVVAEVRWKGASDYAFSLIIGAAFAFLFMVFRTTLTDPSQLRFSLFLLALIVTCIVLAWRMVLRTWTLHVRIIGFVMFILSTLFLLQQ